MRYFGESNLKHGINADSMSYVHGLGDAQEALAEQFDREHEWMDMLKMPCPHCKSESTEWNDYESDSDDWGITYTFDCFCNDCDKEFVCTHYEDMS